MSTVTLGPVREMREMMPRDVTLIAPSETTIETLRRRVGAAFGMRSASDNGFIMIDGDLFVIVFQFVPVEGDYTSEELIATGLTSPRFYAVQFRSLRHLRQVLPLLISGDPNIWVDNGSDPIPTRGIDVLERMKNEPDWTLGVPTMDGS